MSDTPPSSSQRKVWQPPTVEELQSVLPAYEVTAMLGRGGMGAVYKGVQRNLDRPVAIKILPPDLDDEDGSYAARFKNEAKAMAKLNHPGIVKVFDFGETSQGLFYFVMEFIEGTDVSRMIARKGRLAADHAVAITAHVCDALAYAHERGIIHRDIKPANIMVGYDGVVKVADFGLAKMSESAHSGLTRSGMAMGTLHYMAPEALTLGGAVDHRADIYAVGVMFYHMLAGRLPQGLFEPLHQQFPELDSRYDDIVGRAMRDDRELRYPGAAAMRADLDSIISQPVAQVKAPEPPPAALHTAERPQRPAQEDHASTGSTPSHITTSTSVARSGTNWLPWAALLVIGGVVAWLMLDPHAENQSSSIEPAAKPAVPPYTNSLGMKFVSVPGTEVQFCVHETRRQDYAAYATAVAGVDSTWKTAVYDGVPCGDQDNHPVVSVSWEDAQAFCAWLSKKEGRVFRLPTDAEWSLAAGLQGEDSSKTPEERGAQNRGLYPWGKEWPPPPKTGNFADTSTVGHLPGIKEQIAGYSDGFMTTCRVMAFPPNAFGLHDLDGNVSEWTADWFNDKQERRAVRGGAWASAQAGHLLASRRSQTVQMLRYPSYGFRVVVEPLGKTPPLAETKPIAPQPPPAAAFTNSLGMKFVPVPGTQTLFCIHETRRQDYEVYAKENPGVDGGWKGTFGFKLEEAASLPVHGVNWHDAKAFCEWLSRKDGIKYRLPTDREWSFTVGIADIEDPKATPESLRQKVKTHFPWGTEWPPPKDAGNYGDLTTKADFEKVIPELTPDAHPKSAPVMSYRPNALGICDLGGNVGEWCEDWWNDTKTERVLRGGMWSSYSPGYRLSSERMRHKPETRFPYWGFRVIAEAAAPFPAATSAVAAKPLPAPVTNSLGMRFVPVPGTNILMCVHETRRRDYAPYQTAVAGVDSAWKSTDIYGAPFKDDENQPVMRVSWEDAMLYADWLGRKEGRLYRLPTDCEWSHAVGIAADEPPYMTTGELNNKIVGVYPWGTIWPPPAGAGNFADESARALVQNPKLDMKGVIEGFNDGFATLSPVMSLKPNALGLYDLGGNVQEWCMDWHDEKAGRRVMRGACFNRHEETRLLSSRRDHTAYDGRGFNTGFRLVLVPDAKPAALEPLKPPPQTAFTNSLGMRFVPVPGTDICMCVHETRRGDYAKFAADNPNSDPSWRGTIVEGAPENRGDDFAVGAMSWNDATAFCAWLSKKEGRTYRLPTDREWSCAVGIGQDEPPGYSGSVLKNRLPGVYPWGKVWPPKSPVENFADTASKAKFPPGNKMGLTAFIDGYTDGFPTTARVMSFPPNALGIYDLGGNVREWCADHGSSATTGRVMRGGCWKSNDVGDTVSAFRFIREPDKRSSEYGFRIVAEPLPPVAPATPTTETKSPGGAPTPAKPAAVPPTPTAPDNTAPTKPSSPANTPASSMPTAPAQTWTDIQGRSITATFKAIASGNVLLEIAGKVTPVPLNTLSSESQKRAHTLAIDLATAQQGVAGKPFDAITLEDITKDRNLLKQDRIDASDSRVLKVGTVLIYRTIEGRYGKARVEPPAHNENNGRLTLSWCTFGADGKIHSSVMSLVMPSLASFDLDSGTVGRNGEDLRWGLQSPGKPYLARTGDSLLAVLPSSDALTDTPSSNLPSVKPVAVQPPAAPVTSTTAGTLMPPTPFKAPKQTVKIDRLPTSGWRPLVEKWSTIEETHPGVKRKGRETVLQPGTVLAFQGTRNAAVRMRLVYGAFNEPDLKLRWEPEAANNRAYATSADQTRASLTLEKPLTGSGEYPEAFIPSPYLIVGQEYEIALLAVGQTLCLFVNGKRIAEHDLANDPTTGSMLGVTADAGRHEQTFRDIEWCPLDDEGKPLPRSAVIPGVP